MTSQVSQAGRAASSSWSYGLPAWPPAARLDIAMKIEIIARVLVSTPYLDNDLLAKSESTVRNLKQRGTQGDSSPLVTRCQIP